MMRTMNVVMDELLDVVDVYRTAVKQGDIRTACVMDDVHNDLVNELHELDALESAS